MKKIAGILILIQVCSFFLIGVQTVAARDIWEYPESMLIDTQKFYYANRDVYLLSYRGYPISDSSVLNFWSDTGTYYDLESTNRPSGSYYLTCNGTYILELFNAGVKVAETAQIVTTRIEQPACQSYTNADELKNDLVVSEEDNGDGTITLNWDVQSDADHYDVYQDGVKVGDTTGSSYQIDEVGTYTVVAVNAEGDILGESDYITPDTMPTDETGSEDCDACTWLTETLACPAWDEYMGEWKGMLNEVFNASHYQMVADIMTDTIVPAMGQELVDRAPAISEILADELQSREKPVAAPPAPDSVNYEPPEELPELTDIPEVIESDITEDVPNFEPDYSESDAFDLTDPMDIELSDEDAGYNYPDETDTSSPIYENEEVTSEPLEYNYNWHNVPESGPPTYQTSTDDTAPDYQTSDDDDIPNYEGGG